MKPTNTTANRKEYSVKKLKSSYDKVNDLLYVYKEDSSVYSNVMIGEFHLEFNKAKELVGVEVLGASDILSEYDIPKKLLENIDKVELKVVIRNNLLLVNMVIHALNQEKSAKITMNNVESSIMRAIASA